MRLPHPSLKRIKAAIFAALLVLIFVPFMRLSAQDDNPVIYDYVILVDTSGSMMEGKPPLFGQVQTVASSFINAIQDGSNVIIYSFDSSTREVGAWENISPADKQAITARIGAMKAEGQSTAFWDALCQGLTKLEELGASGGQHIQLLISYTDGKDNASRNVSSTCLAKYNELQKSGYTYWIYNAIGGMQVPPEITESEEIVGIVNSDNPLPIRVVNLLPVQLEVGNLFTSGKSNPDTSCLLFWASDPSINGEKVVFDQPPASNRTLPVGVAPQVCQAGTGCTRALTISPSKACLSVELVNFDNKQLAASDLGKYTLTLPLNIPYTNVAERVFLIPNKLKISFDLDYPPTPTPLPTATATPIPFNPNTRVDCGGKTSFSSKIRIEDTASQGWAEDFTCKFKWGTAPLPVSASISIRLDQANDENHPMAAAVWLVKNGEKSKNITLQSADEKFSFHVEFPEDQFATLRSGTHVISGVLLFQPENTTLVGDIDPSTLTIPFQVEVTKALPRWIWFALAGALGLLLTVVVITAARRANRPLVLPVILDLVQADGNHHRASLPTIQPAVSSKNRAEYTVGQSAECAVKFPQDTDLDPVYFNLIGEKTGQKVEISIEPKQFLKVNGLPVSSRKALKHRDKVQIGQREILILIDNQ